ncbi:NADP-dependent 3-hydroxy acid dehydrogenase YdfG [Novosphingobium kunmingense]|uniref:NADP-dependent 3-hydroxy acid dehydrogenase YdfG n=1 Tax=Novosphingobium kunmingense TaxID=1211806 RepID=A0A2N0H665_9SPHN|nr:SDR family NAD(P)-dependent oxidoreductase [Novosphingobium kunmingense]PKB14441.1 NADP-dependent 3-hydroxy acid dehydrogenase YdfG [Novosphingobium kunmingense]
MASRLDGRVVLITGASSGFGAHFARLLAGQGARVVFGARRTDRIAELARDIGDQALAVPLDVTDEASIIAAYDAAEARFGTVDTVIANAGLSRDGRSTEVTRADLDTLLDTNFTGLYLTAREGARRMIAAGFRDSERGRIVLIGSITAEMTAQGDAAYAASKAAVAHLGRQFAREWIRQGINVNTIQPGYIQTEVAGDWFQTEGGARQIAAFHRRRLCPIEALDEPLILLCSDASRHITGATITIDDGQVL